MNFLHTVLMLNVKKLDQLLNFTENQEVHVAFKTVEDAYEIEIVLLGGDKFLCSEGIVFGFRMGDG